jgi:hypothetical protein
MEFLSFLFLPFLLFIFWGPYAFIHAARAIVKRLSVRLGTTQTIQLAFVILLAIFLPVGVTSKGGNIPAIFPWWLAVLGIFTPAGVDLSIVSFIFSIPFVPAIWFFVSREVFRQQKEKTKRANLIV